MSTPIQNRYDFVMLFDCKNGCPNGDPDAMNMPRIDPLTSHCLVTEACLKRKIRREVSLRHGDTPGFRLYIAPDMVLNDKDNEAFAAANTSEKTLTSDRKKNPDVDKEIVKFICENYYDVRAFGGVMTGFAKAKAREAGIRGPVQIGFAESVHRVMVSQISITRQAVASDAESEKSMHTMGSKSILPYGLFMCSGSVSAPLAEKTGFTEEDLNILWESIIHIFDNDASSIRPYMALRKLFVFKHASKYGDAPAHTLVEAVEVQKKDPDQDDESLRSFSDFEVTLHRENIPESVEVIEMVR